jgi:hypothetical protein
MGEKKKSTTPFETTEEKRKCLHSLLEIQNQIVSLCETHHTSSRNERQTQTHTHYTHTHTQRSGGGHTPGGGWNAEGPRKKKRREKNPTTTRLTVKLPNISLDTFSRLPFGFFFFFENGEEEEKTSPPPSPSASS